MSAICVFCGAQSGNDPAFELTAREVGHCLASQGHTVIYGGGSVGLMGVLANACLDRDGAIIGVIPDSLATTELMHKGVEDMRIVPDMHVRKATMHKLSDGYIALPGGYGTMEELFEVLCWGQLSFHQSPIAILNLTGFYDGLVKMIDEMVTRGFLNPAARDLLEVVSDSQQLASWLRRRFAAAVL